MKKSIEMKAEKNIAVDSTCRALADRIARWTEKEHRLETDIPNLLLCRFETFTEPASYTLEPSICLPAQGSKRVLLGEETYYYDMRHYLITSVDLPVIGEVLGASKEKPYLGLVLKLDQYEIAQLMVDSNLPSPCSQQASRGMAVGETTSELLIAFQRLIDLMDHPKDIPILAPLIHREILYRLLTGNLGQRLRDITVYDSHSNQISKAIVWLRKNFGEKLQVKDLAASVGMSISGFHQHFRSLTAMSPLQFQKKLRLNEARRLMLIDKLDVTNAAIQVGYESPSQFSREYSRFFGTPPLRDIKNFNLATTNA